MLILGSESISFIAFIAFYSFQSVMKSANLVMDLIQYPVLYQLTIHPQSNVKLVNVLVFLGDNLEKMAS